MKHLLMISVVLVAAFSIGCVMGGCGRSEKETTTPAPTEKAPEVMAAGYTCSMCGGDYDAPGNCPKCGMPLVEKKAADDAGEEVEEHEEHAH